MPKVSIVIPTHDRPDLFPLAVESVRAAGADIEILVVDDASRDATAAVCRSLGGVRHIRIDRNQQVAGARNIGVLESTAPFVAFLDDDDLRVPGSLDRQLQLLEKHPEVGMVCGTLLIGDQECHPTERRSTPPRLGIHDLFWQFMSLEYCPLPSAVVVRKACFSEVGLFKKELAGIDDWDMWTRIAEVRPVACIEEPVAIYREARPTSGQGSSDIATHYTRAAAHLPRLLDLPRAREASRNARLAARRHGQQQLALHLWRTTYLSLQGGDRLQALVTAAAALRVNPTWFLQPGFMKEAMDRRRRGAAASRGSERPVLSSGV